MMARNTTSARAAACQRRPLSPRAARAGSWYSHTCRDSPRSYEVSIAVGASAISGGLDSRVLKPTSFPVAQGYNPGVLSPPPRGTCWRRAGGALYSVSGRAAPRIHGAVISFLARPKHAGHRRNRGFGASRVFRLTEFAGPAPFSEGDYADLD